MRALERRGSAGSVAAMTIRETLDRTMARLRAAGIEPPRADSEWLLAHVLGVSRMGAVTQPSREVTPDEAARLEALLARRERREPLQHIVGTAAFCGLELEVNGDVLIPRPETELLAGRAVQFLSTLNSQPSTVLDIGTGSGCLAIWIAASVPGASVVAVDVSSRALAVARRNAGRGGVTGRIEFLEGDCFLPVAAGRRFDLIVSNPPYIASGEIDGLQPEVSRHDPRLALDGGVDGLEFYRRLAVEAVARLRGGGRLMVEFGDGQEEALEKILSAHNWVVEEVAADYSHHPRLLTAYQGGGK